MSIDGTWKIVAKTPMGDQESTAVVETSGGVLTGTVSSMFGDVPIEEGRIDGDTASWVLNVTSPFQLSLKHQAVFSGDTVSGEIDTGMFGKSSFTGVKA